MKTENLKVQTFLTHLPLFSDIPPQDLERIAEGTSIVHADKGQTLFRNGDPCVGFHVVVYGQVKLGFTSAQGAEKVIEIT